MSTDDTYLQVKWTDTSYIDYYPCRSVLKIPKDNARFMNKTKLSTGSLINLDKDGYSYMPSLGDVYLKYEKTQNKSGKRITETHMILPLDLLLFRFQLIWPQNDYKMRCKCSEKNSRFNFLLMNPTVKEVIEGVIDKISEYHIRLLSDINICLEDGYIIGIYFKYEDKNGKAQKFLGR